MMLGLPELQLSDDEAYRLALAWERVKQEYPQVELARKWSVLIDLATLAAPVYGSRMGAVMARMKPKPKPQGPASDDPAFEGTRRAMGQAPAPVPVKKAPGGNEIIFPTGAPDNGKIKFN